MKHLIVLLSLIMITVIIYQPTGWSQDSATTSPGSATQGSTLGGGAIDEEAPPPQEIPYTNPATIAPILVFLVIFGGLYWFIRSQPTSDEIDKKKKKRQKRFK